MQSNHADLFSSHSCSTENQDTISTVHGSLPYPATNHDDMMHLLNLHSIYIFSSPVPRHLVITWLLSPRRRDQKQDKLWYATRSLLSWIYYGRSLFKPVSNTRFSILTLFTRPCHPISAILHKHRWSKPPTDERLQHTNSSATWRLAYRQAIYDDLSEAEDSVMPRKSVGRDLMQ